MLSTTTQTQRTLIPINIETLAGTSFELLVSPYEQIQLIKRKIERREGIPSSHQHLIWKSTELDDESCLNDYNIEGGTTLKLVLAMRGGPVNTKRVPIEDSFLRDMSEYIENSRDDYDLSTNKNVTFLVLRDGDQFNFFQVIDRGDGTLSPLSGSISATSMYNTHEIVPVETERTFDEKRQADNRKTKERMEFIRSKLKTHPRKDIRRPLSSSKAIKTNPSELSTAQQQQQLASYSLPGNLFNSYNLLSTKTQLLQEEDSEDTDDEDDSHDDDDEQQQQQQAPKCSSQPIFASRSYSPSIFYQKSSHPSTKTYVRQDTNSNNSTVLIDYVPVSTSSRLSSATKSFEEKKTELPLLPSLPQIVKKPSLPSIKKSQPMSSIDKSKPTTDTFNEHLMLNKRIEILKSPGKPTTSSVNSSIPSSPTPKKTEIKPLPAPVPPAPSSILPIDSTKVTIETIGPKTVSALLRQNATIEPVDTSRGVGKHLVSLLSTGYKQSSRDAVLEERYKLDSKWSTPKMSNPSIVSSSLQSNTAAIYNPNKLPPVIVNRKSTSKCFLCKKKTGLATTYQCRCGSSFCSEHRYPEAHACAFDYKAEGKRLIERNNPLITTPKLPKI